MLKVKRRMYVKADVKMYDDETPKEDIYIYCGSSKSSRARQSKRRGR